MMTDWKEVFENIDNAITKQAVEILNTKGILTDEDLSYVTKGAFEIGKEEFITHLVQHGYTGGELETIGKFYMYHGAIYAIYDTDLYNMEAVFDYFETNYVRSNE